MQTSNERISDLWIDTFPVGALQCNCTIIACTRTREAIVVDPGGDEQQILQRLTHHGLTVRHILHTHAHFDHIGATRDIKEQAGGEIALHPGDDFLYGAIELQGRLFGVATRPTLAVERWLTHDELVTVGAHRLRVVHTPGHTPGSVCFELAGSQPLLLSGDTLFRRGVGRTDLWGGDSVALVESIRRRLYTLEPSTRVIPGHGPTTTIAEESRKNPYVTA